MTDKLNIENLSSEFVNAEAFDVDWQEAAGEYGEGVRFFDAHECEECDTIRVLSGGEECCKDLDPDQESECEGYFNFDGPMMNYAYPIDFGDADEAAESIIHTNLCVVEFEDGRKALALTGCGMDFTWEICSAYIALGYLPPIKYAGRLPRMAGQYRNSDWREIVAACKHSCEVSLSWAQSHLDDVVRVEEWVAAEEKKATEAA